MAKGTRPLQIWKGPKTYTRWDLKTGWIWACWICRIECDPPCIDMPVAYENAIEHLNEHFLEGGIDSDG